MPKIAKTYVGFRIPAGRWLGYAIHKLALRAKNIYLSEKATVEKKRMLLSCIFSNITQNKNKIKPDYTLAFEFFAN